MKQALMVLLTLWVSLFADRAMAGTVTVGTSNACLLHFEGRIEPGDAAKLAAKAPPMATDSQKNYDRWLCLDSPGGSLAEALRMGQILRKSSIGARLVEDATCLSACAILFMSGTVYDPNVGFHSQINKGALYPRRMMHVSSTLGFHRPAIKLDTNKSFDAREVERSFDVSTEASLELVRLVGQGVLATDLVEEMFSHQDSDFFLIDTVGKTLRWNIFTDGETLPNRLDSKAAFDVCNAMVRMKTDFRPSPIRFRPDMVEIVSKPAKDGAGVIFWVRPEPEQQYSNDCMIGVSPEYRETILVCGYYGPRLEKIGGFRCNSVGDVSEFFWQPSSFNSVFALPMDTPLKNMARAARDIEARAAREMASDYDFGKDAFRRRCLNFTGRVRIGGVRNFATMRASGSLNAATVSKLPLASQVQAIDNNVSRATIPGNSRRAQACLRLCQSSQTFAKSSAEWRDLNVCYDENAIWYPVFDSNYKRGFVSGKFLRY